MMDNANYPKLKRVPMPIEGASKYRTIAAQILDAYRCGEAVELDKRWLHWRAAIKQQIERILLRDTGRHISLRLHTRDIDGVVCAAYIVAFGDDAEAIKASGRGCK